MPRTYPGPGVCVWNGAEVQGAHDEPAKACMATITGYFSWLPVAERRRAGESVRARFARRNRPANISSGKVEKRKRQTTHDI